MLDAVLGDRLQPTAILDMSAPPTNESDSEVPQDCDEGYENTIDSSLSSPANSTSSTAATIVHPGINFQNFKLPYFL